MKKIISFVLLSTMLAAFSCACNPGVNTPDIPTPSDEPAGPSDSPSDSPQPQAGTYKFVASALKEKWVPGDKIYVHGSLGSRAEVITLEASNISEDGLVATAELGNVTANLKEPDGLYAAFPDDAVLHVKGVTGTKTTFNSASTLLCVAYLKDDTFTFTDASASISFSATGDFDTFAFAAGNRDGLKVTKYEVDYTSQTSKFSVKSKDGDPFVKGDFTSGKEIKIWVAGKTTLKGGYTIYLGKGEEWISMCKSTEDKKLSMGDNFALGDITSSLVAYDGSLPKMPVMGEVTEYAVKFNELSGLCVNTDGDFLWVVGDNGELGKISLDGKLLGRVTIKSGSPAQSWSIDAEGITIDKATGDLLISSEPNGVSRIPAADLPTIFDNDIYYGVKTITNISAASDYGNSGTEGVTYYKDGKIYVGAQTSAHLFLVDLATGKLEDSKKLSSIFPAISEIAGLSYDPVTDWLWVIDSDTHLFYALTGDASAYLGAYSLKTSSNEESICVDRKNSCIWIGDDAGSTSYVYKYSFTGL